MCISLYFVYRADAFTRDFQQASQRAQTQYLREGHSIYFPSSIQPDKKIEIFLTIHQTQKRTALSNTQQEVRTITNTSRKIFQRAMGSNHEDLPETNKRLKDHLHPQTSKKRLGSGSNTQCCQRSCHHGRLYPKMNRKCSRDNSPHPAKGSSLSYREICPRGNIYDQGP